MTAAPAGFWRAYGVTLRPYLFFVSGAAGLVGLAASPSIPASVVVSAFPAFFLAYGLGQGLTDVFQTDTDALSSPYRPLVRGEIGRGAVLGLSLAGLVVCGVVLAVHNTWNLVLAALAVAGLFAYTPLKRRWWGGPPCNSAVVALLPAMGYLCGEPSLARTLGSGRVQAAAVSVFGSYAVFVLLGYLKDVEADRATGYRTAAVRFGRREAVLASGGFAVTGVSGSVVLVSLAPDWHRLAALPGLAIWTAGITLLVVAHVKAFGVERDADAHPAISLSVRGFLALHFGEAALFRPELAVSGIALLVLFEMVFAQRPCREQV